MKPNVPIDRERAKLFDREAERYDRCRPGYPDVLIDDVLGSSPQGLSVLDVACGTGIASRQMAGRGAHVLGIELNPGMARIAERHGIPTEVGAFETWDPAGRTFDLVTCAQAWHWLDPDTSLETVARVLRPEGGLCLFWNVGQYPDDLAEALQAAYRHALPQQAQKLTIGYAVNKGSERAVDFDVVSNALRARDRFVEPQVKSYPWSRTYTRDQWLDELQSHSDHAALAPDTRKKLLDEVGRTIDAFGGVFRMPYVAILISATRR